MDPGPKGSGQGVKGPRRKVAAGSVVGMVQMEGEPLRAQSNLPQRIDLFNLGVKGVWLLRK
eukprot:13275656-Heterocapsa_arctica.AAC.1